MISPVPLPISSTRWPGVVASAITWPHSVRWPARRRASISSSVASEISTWFQSLPDRRERFCPRQATISPSEAGLPS